MQNPNGMGGMIPQLPKPQGVSMGTPQQAGVAPGEGIQPPQQLSGQYAFGDRLVTYGRPDRAAAVDQAQRRVDSLSAQLQQAQNFGAPPNVLSGLQQQLQIAMRQLQEANAAQQQAAQQALLEQQMFRARREQGIGAVGSGRGAVDNRRGIAALEDAMLANMLGLGGVGGRRY